MFTQGYIGVTSRTAEERFRGHLTYAKSERGKSCVISNVLNKYGREGVVVETLVICDTDYAYDLEYKLRPETRIGWNLAAGGYVSGNYGGYKLSDATRERMSKAKKGIKHSPEAIAKMSAAQKGIPRGPLCKDIVRKRELTRFYNNFYKYPDTWGKADLYYPDFLEGLSPHYACKKHGLKNNQLGSLFGYFRKGWNPCEDSRWIEMKNSKEEEDGSRGY